MKSKIKILSCISLVVLLLFSLMCPVFAYSETGYFINDVDKYYEQYNSDYREYSDGYYIESYNVDINITEENVYEIEETIVAYFDPAESKHGIIRNIPLDSKVTREDGSSDYKYARIKNMEITDEYGDSFDYESNISDVASYKIGSAYRTVAGEVTYKINYDYHLSGDNISDADEVYFNIIGTEWTTNIYNVTFNITTPDPINEDTLGFSVGDYGTTGYDTSKLKYELNGNTLSGEYCETLSSYEGITIRCLFPEGYFEIPFNIREYLYVFTLIIPLILTGISIFIYIRIKKKNKPVEVIEFYPPDDLHSLDIAHIYKGPIGKEDVFSLILYCASKGCVEITEDLCTGEFSFKYIKRYDGHNAVVDKFLFTLFKKLNDTLSMEDIAKDFDDIVITLSKSYVNNDKYITYKTKEKRLLFALNMLIFIFGVFIPMFTARMFVREIDIFFVLIGFVLAIVVAVMRFSVIERTPEGKSLYGRILGFKRFLETAEKTKLEVLVEETPTYFYDILPYTYVLGVSDKWVKKFDDIIINEMDTYKIDRYTFNSSFSSLNDSFNKAYEKAHPSSSSGGSGSSGGGSSGGGSGGGGGSSW